MILATLIIAWLLASDGLWILGTTALMKNFIHFFRVYSIWCKIKHKHLMCGSTVRQKRLVDAGGQRTLSRLVQGCEIDHFPVFSGAVAVGSYSAVQTVVHQTTRRSAAFEILDPTCLVLIFLVCD